MSEKRCPICRIELHPLAYACKVYRKGSDYKIDICQRCATTVTRCLNVVDVDFEAFVKENILRTVIIERRADENEPMKLAEVRKSNERCVQQIDTFINLFNGAIECMNMLKRQKSND